MTTATFRHRTALEAIDAVHRGARARDAESQIVDFKEDAGSVDRSGARRPIDPRHEPAARALADEVACMANSDDGGVIVVGVDDDAFGSDAFVGSSLDTEWLRRRIHALTQPSYSVEVEEHHVAGARLCLIDVPPALEEIRSGGKLRTRQGTACIELTGDRAREFLERRRGYDWTAEPSGIRFSAATARALTLARESYEARHGLAPASDIELARRMGVLVDDGSDDPELNRAGALLIAPFEFHVEQISLLVTPAEGLPSLRSVRGPAPLLERFDEIWTQLSDETFRAAPTIIGARQVRVRAVPDRALREAIVNAIMHRDYRLTRPIVIHATGDPADMLKVRSPGGFPAGVLGGRLISAPSTPRNPVLANAMRVIGLAEAEGIGVDTMYSAMLRAGHEPPSIVEDAGDVIALLRGGRADLDLVAFFDDLRGEDRALDDVRATIAITHLLTHPQMRAGELGEAAQCSTVESLATLERLKDAGAVQRMANRSRTFRLSDQARAQLGRRVRYPTRRRLDEHLDAITAFLETAPEIGRADAAELLGVTPVSAARILGELARAGNLEHVAHARGARVRYRLPGASQD